MTVQYLFSSSEGDVLMTKNSGPRFSLNLRSPCLHHPEDYFQSIEAILDRVEVLVEKNKIAVSDRIGEMLIQRKASSLPRGERRNAGDGTKVNLRLAQHSQNRKGVLLNEIETMRFLNHRFS
jgi:hypothetical protein